MSEIAEINSFRGDIPQEIQDLSPALFDYLRELADTVRVFGTAAVTGSLTLTERELTTRYYGREYPLGVEAKARVNDQAVMVKFVELGYAADEANTGKLVFLDSDNLATETGPDSNLRGCDFTKSGTGNFGWIQTQGVINRGTDWVTGQQVGDSVYINNGTLTLTPGGLLIGEIVSGGMRLSQGLLPHYNIPPDLTGEVTVLTDNLESLQGSFTSLGSDLEFLNGLVQNYNDKIRITLARLESAVTNKEFGSLTQQLAQIQLGQAAYELKLESITTDIDNVAELARGYAKASYTESVHAKSGADQSGFWAGVAQRRSLDAQSFSNTATTQATIATNASVSATASAASASASATLAATYTGGQAIPGIFADPVFENKGSPWELPWMMTYRGGLGTGAISKQADGRLRLTSGKSGASDAIFLKMAQSISGTQYYTSVPSSHYKIWRVDPGSRIIVKMKGITTGLDRFRPKFYLVTQNWASTVSSGYGVAIGSNPTYLTTTQGEAVVAFDIPADTTAYGLVIEFEGDLIAGGTNISLTTQVDLDFLHAIKVTQDYDLVPPSPAGLGALESRMQAAIVSTQTVNATQDTTLASHTTTLSSHGGSITTLQSTTSTHTSQIATINTTLSTQGASLTTQAAAITDLEGRTEAYWLVDSVAGSGRAQLKVWADAVSGGGVDIIGDVQINGSLLVTGSISTGKIGDSQVITAKVANDAITDFTSASLGSTLFGSGSPQTVTDTTIVMDYDGDIAAIVSCAQSFAGDRSWNVNLSIDSTSIFTTSGTKPGDSVCLAGMKAVSSGNRQVLVTRTAAGGCDMTAAAVVIFRRYK